MSRAIGRRDFVRSFSGLGVSAVWLACASKLAAQELPTPPGSRLVRAMPLGRFGGRAAPPLRTLLGNSLDARLFSDLSEIRDARSVTPIDQFYVRTAHPPALPPAASWHIALGGRVRAEGAVTITELRAAAASQGVHLMECAGNADPANFGLLSVATWSGVPMNAVLDRMAPRPDAHRLRVAGVDDESGRSQSSQPGASWIFSRDELERAGAFLALGMNDAPLPLDHGAPVRLVVPNYFGCSCIKWVSRIDWVPDDEPLTPQMREFAARTHQTGTPERARDYQPPVIELAATPIRVEQWMRDDRVLYRVVGIRWGGSARRVPLTIRFRHTEPFVPVETCPDAERTTTWSLWSHTWRPEGPGRYQIALRVADPAIPARRLDLFYYTREVEIDRV